MGYLLSGETCKVVPPKEANVSQGDSPVGFRTDATGELVESLWWLKSQDSHVFCRLKRAETHARWEAAIFYRQSSNDFAMWMGDNDQINTLETCARCFHLIRRSTNSMHSQSGLLSHRDFPAEALSRPGGRKTQFQCNGNWILFRCGSARRWCRVHMVDFVADHFELEPIDANIPVQEYLLHDGTVVLLIDQTVSIWSPNGRSFTRSFALLQDRIHLPEVDHVEPRFWNFRGPVLFQGKKRTLPHSPIGAEQSTNVVSERTVYAGKKFAHERQPDNSWLLRPVYRFDESLFRRACAIVALSFDQRRTSLALFPKEIVEEIEALSNRVRSC